MLKWMLNYDIKEAGFTGLLTPSEGRFSTSKGDVRIQTRPLTRLAEKPGGTMGRTIRRCISKVFAGPYWAVLWAVAALRLVGQRARSRLMAPRVPQNRLRMRPIFGYMRAL